MNFTEYLQITQVEMLYLFLKAMSTDDDVKMKEILSEADVLVTDMRKQGLEKEKLEKQTDQINTMTDMSDDVVQSNKKKSRFFRL